MIAKITHLICAVMVPLLVIPMAVDVCCAACSHLFPQQTPAPPAAVELHAGVASMPQPRS